jgi:sec-independent protein translocase protein TatA
MRRTPRSAKSSDFAIRLWEFQQTSAETLTVFNRANLVKERTMFEGLFQPMHLVVIFGIALLVFGPKKLPELGKGIGEGIRGFKSAIKAEEDKPATTISPATDPIMSKE